MNLRKKSPEPDRKSELRKKNGGYTLQLGLEQGDQTRLVEKDVTPDEIREIFRKFYDLGIVEGIEKYKPVKFK